jgi:hypothetical protein
MRNTKAILVICAMVASIFAHAAHWTAIGLYDVGTFYIDTDSVTVSGERRKVWTSLDYREPQLNQHDQKTYKSTRMQMEFDCHDQSVRTLSLSYHSGVRLSGETLSTEGVIEQFELVPIDTPVFKIMRQVC